MSSYVLKPFIGLTIKEAQHISKDDCVAILFEGDRLAVLGVEGGCYSNSWIEHVTIPNDIKGAVVVSVEDICMSSEENDEYDLLQSYETRINTNRGPIVMEYRNSSNGFYGGYPIVVSDTVVKAKR